MYVCRVNGWAGQCCLAWPHGCGEQCNWKCKDQFLKDIFFGSWGSIGIPVEMLSASFLGFQVTCGQRNDSNGGGI